MGQLGNHRKGFGGFGWTGADISDFTEGRRGICRSPGKRRCVHHHAEPAFAVPVEIIKSAIPDPKFRIGLPIRYQVLSCNEGNGYVERHHKVPVYTADDDEEVDMGGQIVLEIPRTNYDSDVLESVTDK